MSFLIGLVSGLGVAYLTWRLATAGSSNLPSPTALALSIGLAALAAVVTFLAGSALSRRTQHTRRQLALFGSVAFAVAGGIIGGACTVALTAAYVRTFGGWPESRVDLVLTVLSYPVFGLLGAGIGAILGSIVGLVVSGALRLVTPAPR